ncbi:MAG: hypothetical protein GEU93_17425 [Propionibacteriales bacterium]|nr:hypothetical protein [Propionibacteriales bacterium]
MQITGYVALAAGLGVAVLAGVRMLRLHHTARELEARARDTAERVRVLPPDLVEFLGDGDRRVIAVELLNPFELAGKRTWFAGPLAAMTPGLLRRVVYDQAVTQIRDKTSEMGIRADVRVHRAE